MGAHTRATGSQGLQLLTRTQNCLKGKFAHMLHVWYVYLDLGDFVQVNVGKLSSTMVRIWDMIKDPQ